MICACLGYSYSAADLGCTTRSSLRYNLSEAKVALGKREERQGLVWWIAGCEANNREQRGKQEQGSLISFLKYYTNHKLINFIAIRHLYGLVLRACRRTDGASKVGSWKVSIFLRIDCLWGCMEFHKFFFLVYVVLVALCWALVLHQHDDPWTGAWNMILHSMEK